MVKGLRVVKRGAKIRTHNPNEIQYSSEFVSPKIYAEGSGKVRTNSSGSFTVEIPHDLGYPPACFIYVNPVYSAVNGPVGGGTFYPIPGQWGLADNIFDFVTPKADKVLFQAQSRSANQDVNYKYFIFVEPAKEDE